MHGRKCKLKAFLRWESGNRHDPRVEDIRAGRYISTKTIDDLLTEEEIKKIREAAKDNPRDLAMVDFHLLWGLRPSESASLNVGHIKVNENYVVVNIPETETTAGPVPIPLAKASVIQDPSFLDYALRAYMSMRVFFFTKSFTNSRCLRNCTKKTKNFNQMLKSVPLKIDNEDLLDK